MSRSSYPPTLDARMIFSGTFVLSVLGEHAASLLRRAAEFLQALAALLPGGGVEDVDGRQLIHFETGDHLGPEA